MRVLFWVVPLVLGSAACGSSSPTSGGPKETQVSNHEQPPEDGNDLTGTKTGPGDGGSGGVGGIPLPQGGGGNTSGGAGGSGGSGGTGAKAGATTCAGWSSNPVARVDVGDTNDTMSAERAREALALGVAPSPTQIRPRDFFNLYSGPTPSVDGTAPVLSLELRERIVPAEYDLLITLSAPTPPRPRSVFTVIVDTTPSMAGIALARAQMVVKALGDALVPGDFLHILTTDAKQGSKTFNLTGQPGELEDASAWLQVSTGGDLAGAIDDAYDVASVHADAAATNRVILVSDGAEPVELLPTSLIDSKAMAGIRLVGIGTGPTTTYRERLLADATETGRGAYAYVDNQAEAENLFQKRFDRLFGVLYDELRVEVTLPEFLRKVESPDLPVGGGVPQALPPGATYHWLMRLESCDPLAYQSYAGTQLVANAYFVDPVSRNLLAPVTTSIASKPQPLTTPLPDMDKALATKAYVEALQSVNKQRIDAALIAIEKAQSESPAAAEPDADLAEMAAMLNAHPAGKLP